MDHQCRLPQTQQEVFALLLSENALLDSLHTLKTICIDHLDLSSELLTGLKAAIRHYYSNQQLSRSKEVRDENGHLLYARINRQ